MVSVGCLRGSILVETSLDGRTCEGIGFDSNEQRKGFRFGQVASCIIRKGTQLFGFAQLFLVDCMWYSMKSSFDPYRNQFFSSDISHA